MDSGVGGLGGGGPMSHFWSLAQWEALGWEADVGGSHFPTSALLFSSDTVIHGHSLAQLVKHQNGSHGCPSYCRNQSSGWRVGGGGGGGRDVKGQHPLSIQGAASAVKGQHLCVWWWGLHQQLRHWEDLPHGGGGGGAPKATQYQNALFIEVQGSVISQEWSCPQFSSFRVNVRHGLQLTSLRKLAHTVQFSHTEKGCL